MFCPRAGPLLQAQEPRLQFYQRLNRVVASRCFPHSTLSLVSEQTLKDLKRPRGTNVQVRRVDLANWALRTSPKFTRRVKISVPSRFFFYQIRDPEIPDYPSPPISYILYLSFGHHYHHHSSFITGANDLRC